MTRSEPSPKSTAALVVIAICAAAMPTCCSAKPTDKDEGKQRPPSGIKLTSAAFDDGQPMPAKYTADGEDVSPPLSWTDLPEGTKELALIMDDSDAKGWVHWVIYKIPADAKGLDEGIPRTEALSAPAGALQGKNSWPDKSGEKGNIGYRGPSPPSGVHHYHFKAYALDAKLDVKPRLTRDELFKAMAGHILATGELVGTYKR